VIKILTGWSHPGGSTLAHINLCNLFNENGYECRLYGPHYWHLGKCKGDLLNTAEFSKEDTVIAHWLATAEIPAFRKFILSCHETNLFPLKEKKLDAFDFVHFVSEFQKEWQDVDFPSVVIPNVLSDLKESPLNTGAAAVIGSIDEHKRTDLSIRRALDDGYEKVYVYGLVTDGDFFEKSVHSLLSNTVEVKGYVEDKQVMYDSVDAVYHSSDRETFNYIKGECELTGVAYNGLDSADPNAEYLSSEDILDKWVNVLEL